MIIRDLMLLIRAPKEFIYSFTYSNNKFVRVIPFDPVNRYLANQLIIKIKNVYPGLSVHLLSSVALGIAGQNDIDIFIECNKEKLKDYLKGLIGVLGSPKKIRANFIEWAFTIKNSEVQVLLIDPKNPLLEKVLKTFGFLKQNKEILKAYEKLKIDSNGVSEREYARRKLEFFVSNGL
jgi:hypothetical protein